jgi:TRAP-type C4-dicarboxylate transport system substrate-binding protein
MNVKQWLSLSSTCALWGVLSLSHSFAAREIKMATIAPQGTPWADSLEQIKSRIESESKQKMKVKTFLGGQLGGELEILTKVRRGQIQGAGLTAGAVASIIPELDLLEIPYLFESNEEVDYVLDKHLWPYFKKLFEQKGLVLVSWAENGWRSLGHKSKPLLKPDDLKGVKIRSQETKVHLNFWKKMGAIPNPIAVPEVLPALQTGVVEAFDNTPLFILSAEWQTAIKHFTNTQHIYQPAVVVYSKKFFDSLSAEEKKVALGPENKQALLIRENVRKLGDSLLQVLKDSGVTVHQLTPEGKQAFIQVSLGLAQQAVTEAGVGARKILEEIEAGKKQFKNLKK